MPTFEKLEIWSSSIKFAIDVFNLTKSFDRAMQFSLGDQIRRASLSISSNIAEGSGAESRKDEIRFLDIAIKSCFECVSQLMFFQQLSGNDVSKLIEEARVITKRVRAYRKVRFNFYQNI